MKYAAVAQFCMSRCRPIQQAKRLISSNFSCSFTSHQFLPVGSAGQPWCSIPHDVPSSPSAVLGFFCWCFPWFFFLFRSMSAWVEWAFILGPQLGRGFCWNRLSELNLDSGLASGCRSKLISAGPPFDLKCHAVLQIFGNNKIFHPWLQPFLCLLGCNDINQKQS